MISRCWQYCNANNAWIYRRRNTCGVLYELLHQL